MSAVEIQVLLVEDNPGDADLMQLTLAESPREKFVVRHVTRVREALAALNTSSFDVVLLDLGLPDAQGLEALESVHRAAPRTPIVVLTGLSDQSTGMRAIELGAQDYLVKGWQQDDKLVTRILSAIERRKLRNDLAEADENLRAAGQRLKGLQNDPRKRG